MQQAYRETEGKGSRGTSSSTSTTREIARLIRGPSPKGERVRISALKKFMKRLPELSVVASAILLTAIGTTVFGQSTATQPTSASAPGPAAPSTTLKVQVNEVILPVTVRDKKGETVPNLKQDDFVLQED